MTTEWDALPDNVKKFMTALDARQGARAITVFTADAVVTDEGHDHSGRDEIEAWLTASVNESEYTYTSEFTGATATGTTVDVTQHLEGNFPGGVADLHYRFTLDGALINRLVIEP
ncbi:MULTISPECIES: nuclear transport factor 2 family protein [unclassified Rhodococcus (in: high G+C Gram-positive bacteria)]|uniref:nuclear transport factor 2 family protein n=1 Tax=unclassified Rhodococcus (in: high G+C Gram-positive bacteria) TaxID=192944 RepID=UPI0020CF4859|nr:MULTISPECIES: nuclear transport factor 2 family protein [unclassified Rhodococcus (in: high G+C Gram-positive bacteria)]